MVRWFLVFDSLFPAIIVGLDASIIRFSTSSICFSTAFLSCLRVSTWIIPSLPTNRYGVIRLSADFINVMIEIRIAKPEDAEEIASVHVACWRETYASILPQKYLAQLNQKERRKVWRKALNCALPVFVATQKGTIIGFANGGKNRCPEIKAVGEIYALYLLACHQGQGVGRQLFQIVQENLISCNLHPFLTWVLTENPACGFYDRMGGTKKSSRLMEIGDTTLKEIAFIWKD